jgi:carbonic anhydrase
MLRRILPLLVFPLLQQVAVNAGSIFPKTPPPGAAPPAIDRPSEEESDPMVRIITSLANIANTAAASNRRNAIMPSGLIAALGAGLGGILALHLGNLSATRQRAEEERDFRRRHDQRYQHYYDQGQPPTFLENGRTRVPQTAEDELAAGVSQGWSMAEALEAAKKDAAKMANMTPREVLQSLQRGNMRFYSGHASRPEKSAFHRRALISQQFPSTAVLGCSDSRVPVEIVFDQGLGDMFVVRVAGNCLGLTTRASLEYAVHHLNVKVLMVMGHEGCGAIKAAGLPVERIDQEPEALASVLKEIKSVLEKSTHMNQILDARARDREAVAANVANQVAILAEDPAIMAKIEAGNLKIVGAFYEISSGIVDFFHLVAQEVPGEPFKPSPGVHSRYNPKTKEVVYA